MLCYITVPYQIILIKTWKCIQRCNDIAPSRIIFELQDTTYMWFGIKWLKNNIRYPVSWKMFSVVTQEMRHHMANGSSIFSLDSKHKETISPKVLSIAPLYSFEKKTHLLSDCLRVYCTLYYTNQNYNKIMTKLSLILPLQQTFHFIVFSVPP